MSAIASNPVASQTQSSAATGSSSSNGAMSANSLSTEFLQLLIAQLKNQDPENPTDGTTFVTQLATFTNVQQQTQATADLGAILSVLQAADPSTAAAANRRGSGAAQGSSNGN